MQQESNSTHATRQQPSTRYQHSHMQILSVFQLTTQHSNFVMHTQLQLRYQKLGTYKFKLQTQQPLSTISIHIDKHTQCPIH